MFLLEICRSDTFGAIKQKIEQAEGYAVGEQHFAWEDEHMLDEFHDGSTKFTATLRLWLGPNESGESSPGAEEGAP